MVLYLLSYLRYTLDSFSHLLEKKGSALRTLEHTYKQCLTY